MIRRFFPNKLRSLRLPSLRLYQQIMISYLLVVLVPLVALGVAIYSINQTALKKELGRFSEQTAKSLDTELSQQVQWERRTALLTVRLLENSTQNLATIQGLLAEQGYHAIGLYQQGQLQPYQATQGEPSLTLPASLTTTPSDNLEVKTPPARPSDYYLQLRLLGSKAGTEWILIRPFKAMNDLIHSKGRLFSRGITLVNEQGRILAGSNGADLQAGLSATDLAILKQLPDGQSKRLMSGPTSRKPDEDEDAPPLEKVFVKVPELGWGIVIESPYHVPQKYIKRARSQTLVLMGIYLSLVLIFGLFYILGINRNFRQLLKATKALTQGNYSRRIWLIRNATTPYEIIYLAAEFNRMARRMAESWHSIQLLNQELQGANAKLAKLDELKSNLIDTVSHELRTPLTSIKGYTSRLIRYEDTLDAATRQKSLKIVKQQADRLGRLVDDLLVIPELESARLRVYPDNVSLLPLIEQCIHVVSDRENRDIQVSAADSSALNVLADPDRLEQVVLNLLDNAVKYSREATTIHVAILAKEQAVLLQVHNQSEPIPEAMLEKLFDKFTRMDDQLTRTTRGSGLGLFITKGLIESMGGNICLSCQGGVFEATVSLQYYEAIEPLATGTLPVASVTPQGALSPTGVGTNLYDFQ